MRGVVERPLTFNQYVNICRAINRSIPRECFGMQLTLEGADDIESITSLTSHPLYLVYVFLIKPVDGAAYVLKVPNRCLSLEEEKEAAKTKIENEISAYKAVNEAKISGVPQMWHGESKRTDDNVFAWLCVEYCEGKEFLPWIYKETEKKDKQRFAKDFRFIIFQVWRILASIDKAGMYHGDVKPDNILFDSEQRKVWLVDFETSGKKELLQDSGRGTSGYIAPEVATGAKVKYDKADLFSLMMTALYGYFEATSVVRLAFRKRKNLSHAGVNKLLEDIKKEVGVLPAWLDRLVRLANVPADERLSCNDALLAMQIAVMPDRYGLFKPFNSTVSAETVVHGPHGCFF